MNSLTPETASTLLLMDNMEELDWYFQDIFNQFGNMYCLFDNINRLLEDCPLEFFLFEVQQLISFLWQHWNASHPCLRTMILRPLPYSIAYSSETFAPLIQKNRQISHVQYLLWGQHTSLAHFQHYLTTCSTIFSLEQTLRELCDNQDYVFAEFVTTNTVNQLQPFLVQTRQWMHTPISIATTTDTNSILSQPVPQQNRQRTPPVTWIPHTYHDNAPLPVATPSKTPTIVCVPTPIPPTSTSVTCYVSPLVIRFNPCTGCGSADGHLPGCSIWSQGLHD